MSRDVTLYVDDMIEACRRIVQYTEGMDRDRMTSDLKTHDAVLRNLEMLGKAGTTGPSRLSVGVNPPNSEGETKQCQ